MWFKFKVVGQRSRSTCKQTCFYRPCTVHLTCNLEAKGHKYQGQRSHRSRSNKDSKQRQVGSQQRQVASFLSEMEKDCIELLKEFKTDNKTALC